MPLYCARCFTNRMATLLLFECVVGKCYVMFCDDFLTHLPGARFTKRFKTNFILSLNLGLISVKICLILKDVLTLS